MSMFGFAASAPLISDTVPAPQCATAPDDQVGDTFGKFIFGPDTGAAWAISFVSFER
jgi:hypothetical protein